MHILSDYIKMEKCFRQSHLELSTSCIERGGNSQNHRGVLAQYLNTSMEKGNKIVLAHACNNGKCSNPKHLYWATHRENIVEDGLKFGTYKTAWQRSIEKYGSDYKGNNSYVKNNKFTKKGDKLTEEHKQKISESLKNGSPTWNQTKATR